MSYEKNKLPKKKIYIKKKLASNDYEASYEETSVTGSTPTDALGFLVSLHGEMFGIKVIDSKEDVSFEKRCIVIDNVDGTSFYEAFLEGKHREEKSMGRSMAQAVGNYILMYGGRFPDLEVVSEE